MDYYTEEYHNLLSELMDCIQEVTDWYGENNVLLSPPERADQEEPPRNVKAKAGTKRRQSGDKAERGGGEVERETEETDAQD